MPEPTTHPDYLQAAKANLNEANKAYSSEQFVSHISAAQAQATIALAEEQRTANLIAFYNMSAEDAEALIQKGVMTTDKFEALAKLLVERLGLS